jgi:hypothetical protein
MVALALTFLLIVAGFQPADGVSVTTSSSSYAPGAAIDVTVENNGPDRVTRGGIVCDDVWPLSIEQLLDDGTWQPQSVPTRANCIAIAGVLFGPGQSLNRSVSLMLDPGTYRVGYTFDVVGSPPGQMLTAYSDPFAITAPTATVGISTASSTASESLSNPDSDSN